MAVVIAAIYLVVLFPTPEFPAYNSDDGSYFVTLALNLLDRGRYSTDTWPGSPYGHHATWPPLQPLLLAGVVCATGLSWVAIKGVMALLGLVGLYLWWRLLKREPFGPTAVLALSLSPAYFLFSHHPMTEVPFMALCAAILLALNGAKTIPRAFIAGLIAAAAFMLRGYAVAFLPAAMIWFGTRNEIPWRYRLMLAAGFGVPLLVAILGWHQYSSRILQSLPLDVITTRFGNGTSLFSALTGSPVQHLRNLYWFEFRYPAHFVAPFMPLEDVLGDRTMFSVAILSLGLAVVGWFNRIRSSASPGDIWVPCMALVVYVVTIGNHGIRYWMTLIPFGFLYLFNGIRVVARYMKAPAIGHVGVGLVTASIAAGLTLHVWQPDRLRFASAHWKAYQEVALWAAGNLPADSAVVAHAAHKFYALTRLAVYPAELATSIARASVYRDAFTLCGEDDHVPSSQRIWCRSNMAGEKPVYSIDGLGLYRLRTR